MQYTRSLQSSGSSVVGEVSTLLQVVEDLPGHDLGRLHVAVLVMDLNGELGVLGGLIGVIDASEALDLSGAGSLVQSLGIASLALLNRNVHEDLNEVTAGDTAPDGLAVNLVRRDEAHEGDGAVLCEQLGDLTNAANILDTVVGGKAEVLVQAVPDVVAVEVDGELAHACEGVLESAGHGGLAAAAEASEPQDAALLVKERLLVATGHHALVPLDVGGITDIVGGGLRPALERSGFGSGHSGCGKEGRDGSAGSAGERGLAQPGGKVLGGGHCAKHGCRFRRLSAAQGVTSLQILTKVRASGLL